MRIAPTRSEARGIEFMAKHDVGGRFAWSASYALAEAKDEVDGEWLWRPYDQRHTVRLDAAYRPNPRWSLSWAWQYHSGWPITPQTAVVDTAATGLLYYRHGLGPMYSERLPAYHRFDVRVSRHFPLGRGRLLLFLDIFNLYDRDNVKAFNYSLRRANATTINVVRHH
jgi:outer membrane receptor protein involved in Fe transport